MSLESVLIANRGEIAVRVIRTANEMGLRTIAIYSELDRDSLHVALADEAWNVGGAPAAESYLNMDRILQIAQAAKAGAIHPGYGFLAENATFAQRVIDTGIAWVGPPPDAISTMGDKIASRRAVAAAGVQSVPGTLEPLANADEIAAIAESFGYPVAIKAAHGGGGKGLRVVAGPEGLAEAFDGAQREADAYFGNAAVYVEKYLSRPRHIEAQIFVAADGTGYFLGERDCSVQRRHQKLIEESPAPTMSDAQRATLSKAALAVAEACDYRNAGTVEFLMDTDGELYFLEMNTRLQVEHTVTEMVMGVDLVRAQLMTAGGEIVDLGNLQPRGHAIEFRINAEDPATNFMPSPGQIVHYRDPGGYGIRVDGWVQSGSRVSQYYDNLVAKLVVWGATRDEAIERSRRALQEYVVDGIATTIPAHLAVINDATFQKGSHHTRYVEDELDLSGLKSPTRSETLPEDEETDRRSMTVEVGGKRFDVAFWAPAAGPTASGPGAPRRRPPKLKTSNTNAGADAGVIVAPMQGTIVKISSQAGSAIDVDEPICVLEAMKMENEVRSPVKGELVELRVQAGDTVAAGQVIAIVR